ncbi:MAG: GntR family transcriptional regulator [Burkholderiales bacterium]|nr:GntR family transcriptional regulator [Burkholderiales bacterium]
MLKPIRRSARYAAGGLPLPRYHQVYLVLREQIVDGRFESAKPLPGEHELAGAFGVSRVTMRAALDRLVAEGLIERQRGRGTFARAAHARPAVRADLSGLLENLVALGLKTSVRLVELAAIQAPADVAEALGIAPGTPVQKAIRVRSLKGAPLSHITTFVPLAVASFDRRALSARPMLALLEDAGIEVASADQALSAKLADHAVAPLLEVGLGAALLAVTRVVYGADGRAVQLLRGLYRPDRYEYHMHLTRSGGDTPRIWISGDRGARSQRAAAAGPRPARTPRRKQR